MTNNATVADRRYRMNILLIQLKRIGDLILTTPAIAAVRKKFPDANIALVISAEGKALAPAIAGVNKLLVMPRGLAGFGTAAAVARGKFDYCVDFTRNDRSALLVLLSRAKKRIVSLGGGSSTFLEPQPEPPIMGGSVEAKKQTNFWKPTTFENSSSFFIPARPAPRNSGMRSDGPT